MVFCCKVKCIFSLCLLVTSWLHFLSKFRTSWSLLGCKFFALLRMLILVPCPGWYYNFDPGLGIGPQSRCWNAFISLSTGVVFRSCRWVFQFFCVRFPGFSSKFRTWFVSGISISWSRGGPGFGESCGEQRFNGSLLLLFCFIMQGSFLSHSSSIKTWPLLCVLVRRHPLFCCWLGQRSTPGSFGRHDFGQLSGHHCIYSWVISRVFMCWLVGVICLKSISKFF